MKISTGKYKTIDLFAGIGGIRLGFENAGFQTVFANDSDLKCKITYDFNFSEVKLTIKDVRELSSNELPDFDLLLGGFPCQAFSIAGYRQGFDDSKGRGNLFFEIERILLDRQPKAFMLENVKNLKNHDEGRTYSIIATKLSKLGYHIDSRVLNSLEYGNVPQNRERIYIVGFLEKQKLLNFTWPTPIPLSKQVKDILEKDVPLKYYYENKPLFEKLRDHVKVGGVYQWRRQYVRENKKNVCPTLTANMGMGGHNVPIIKDDIGIRKLMPIECARIQGFPLNYKLPAVADSVLYKQIGNSVTVPVIEAMARQIFIALDS